MILLLHTCPERSLNAGDWLISHSLQENLELITNEEIERCFIQEPLDDKLSGSEYSKVVISALSVFNNVYPKFAPLVKDLSNLKTPLFPVGCTWQHPIGFPEFALEATLNEPTKRFFERLVSDGGPIPTRDHQAKSVLELNGIRARFVGDCGLYDPASIGKPIRRLTEVGSVVFTTPHNRRYRHQAFSMLDHLAERFPEADRFIALHSIPGPYERALEEHAHAKGFKTLNVFEERDILLNYDRFDLHVGYRLHGHIGALRKRIPSVLLAEDARANGFRTSFPIGCFPALRALVDPLLGAAAEITTYQKYVTADELAPKLIMRFLEQELETGFLRYAALGAAIDAAYHEAFMPVVEAIAGR